MSNGILSMFARSPVRPLQRHMSKAQNCAELLVEFVEAAQQTNWAKAAEIRKKLNAQEHEADALKMDFRIHLTKDLFLPVPRSDLLELLSQQEQIANISKDISGIMLGRKMVIPEKLANQFKLYLQRSVEACSQATKAISELDELLEAGFRGKEVGILGDLIEELNKIEYDTDQMQIQLRESLFSIEKGLQPVDTMFLYKIIDWIGMLADCAQKVGNRLRMFSAN